MKLRPRIRDGAKYHVQARARPAEGGECPEKDKNGNIESLVRNGSYEGEDYEIQIDDLKYVYDTTKKNQLMRVTDSSGGWDGFNGDRDNDGNTANDDYTYDANGNMTADDNKGITNIKYNHLNLPFSITFANPHNKVTRIDYLYDAAGKKVAKKAHYYEPGGSGGGGSEMKGGTANATPTNSSVGPTTYVQKMTQTDYLAGGFQYKDEALDLIPHAEGFIKLIEGDYVYHFNYTDHLGNVRLTYKDKGGVSIVEESNYYPFGLEHSGYNNPDRSAKDWGNIVTSVTELDYKYKYNGKEFQDELGLNVYDYGARVYQPDAPHFWQIDPKAEKYYSLSPYVYVADNPINAIDPDGKDIIFVTRNSDGSAKEQFKYRNGNFYHENGKRYNPGKEGVSKTMYATLAAYRKIESSGNKELKNMLHTLEKSKNKHFIESGQTNEVSSKTSALSIENHQSTEKVKNGEGVGTRTTHNFTQESKDDFEKSTGVPNSNLSTVVHEMRHQYDYDQGKMADSVNKSGAEDPAEKRAVESENEARKIDGLPKRTTYDGVKIIQD